MYLAAICFSLAVDVDIDRYMVKNRVDRSHVRNRST